MDAPGSSGFRDLEEVYFNRMILIEHLLSVTTLMEAEATERDAILISDSPVPNVYYQILLTQVGKTSR